MEDIYPAATPHGEENFDVAQHGYPTKVIFNLLLGSIKCIVRCLEVVHQDQTGLCRSSEQGNNHLDRNLPNISRYL